MTMTVRMTKQQILQVNAEQARTIHKLREETRHKQQIIDQMLHDKEPDATQDDMDERVRRTMAKTQEFESRISSLEEELRGNLRPSDNRTFRDDPVYKNAMRSMRMDVPPTITDVSFVQTGTRKYPKEIANSKQFMEWAVKWGKELFELMGGCK